MLINTPAVINTRGRFFTNNVLLTVCFSEHGIALEIDLLFTLRRANPSFQELIPTDKGGKNSAITSAENISIFCILHIRGILAMAE